MNFEQLQADERKLLEDFLLEKQWAAGNLRFKFKPCQERMFDDIFEWDGLKYVIKCARRLGKTFMLCAIAIMLCLRKKHALVRFAAPTNKALKKIIVPVMRTILFDCPEHLRPTFKASEGVYYFPSTGAEMHLAGVNNQPENLRGTACDLFIIDEAGSINDLDYVVNDLAMPQFLDPDGNVVKGRRLLMASSPPRTPAHEFTEIARVAETEGNYSHFDIYDAGYPEDTIEIFKKESGGEQTTTWKREYLALDVIDENYALCREWDAKYIQAPVVDQYFSFYLKYNALDVGVRDFSVCLFAHYDFKQAKLFVHNETWMNGPDMTTDALAKKIIETNKITFADHPISKQVSDVDLLLIQDLNRLHKQRFLATDKGSLEEMVNNVRLWVKDGRVIVAPRCKQLIGCLSSGVWNESRRDFERSKAYGHFDAFAALMYLIRNVDVNHNPIPVHYGKSADDYWINSQPNQAEDKLKKAFNLK